MSQKKPFNNKPHLEKYQKKSDIGWRHLNLDLISSLFIVRDQHESLFFLSPERDEILGSHEEIALWSTSKAIGQIYKTLFESLWKNADDARKRVTEIEAGTYMARTI